MAQLLKERREETGRGIDEAAEITRIKESYLNAIEEEDFSKLPIEVYTKGYIREYAKFLGVPSEDIIARYERYLDEKKGIRTKGSLPEAKEKPLNIDELADNNKPLGNVITSASSPMSTEIKWGFLSRKAFLIIPFLAIIVVAYFFFVPKNDNSPVMPLTPIAPPVPVQQAPQVNAVQPDTQVTPQVPPEKTEDKTKNVSTEAKAKSDVDVSQKKKYTLELKATDKSWIQIIIDGSEKRKMMVNAGDRVVLGANESFNILVGNAAGVSLKYNDKQFDNLGEKGQVVRLNLPEMTTPQVVTIKKKDPEAKSESPKSQTPNPVNQ